MKKKAIILILTTAVFIIINSGCTRGDNDPRPLVITTLFPQYDFARQIGGEKINLKLLLNPGVEAHSFEPTPHDIADISKARLFIYTGEFMEPWAERILKGIKNENLVVVNAGENIALLDTEDLHQEYGKDEDPPDEHGRDQKKKDLHEKNHHGNKDPHIWVDPINAVSMIDNILQGFIKADPENSNYYTENAESCKDGIIELHEDFKNLFRKSKYKKIIYAGHFAFGYFAHRYGLEYISPYKGFSPNAEPGTREIAALIKSIEESGTKVIYYQELSDPKIARVISEQTGAEMILLHGAHNISKKEFQEGITYISIMRKNLESLKKGLGYTE